MARPAKLDDAQLQEALAALPEWKFKDGKLHREFKFVDFIEAWGFMSRAALHAQALDHHPEWFNVYGTVRVDLSTHDAGGITKLDIELARKMNALVKIDSDIWRREMNRQLRELEDRLNKK